MTRYTLHVPLKLNDGTPTPDAELAYIERQLVGLVGGFTATDGVGAWESGEVIYHEPVRLYSTDSEDDIAADLRGFARGIGKRLDQEAVYVTAQTIEAWVVITEAIDVGV